MGKLILVIGTDGAGKTHFTNWLADSLKKSGKQVEIVWSRFNNYLSKPFLAATRLTGHNYYTKIDGTLFGFHDFEKLAGWRYLFAGLQSVDVNLATRFRIVNVVKRSELVICERGPWDTLVDVMADTGITHLDESMIGKIFVRQLKDIDAIPVFIDRSPENIYGSRPELVNDKKLPMRHEVYQRLAKKNNWSIIDNNGTEADTKKQLVSCLHEKGIDL